MESITREDLRRKGIMAATLQDAVNKYPNAVFTAYIVNSDIRRALGEEAITKPSNNILNTHCSSYLVDKIKQTNISLLVESVLVKKP